MKIYLAGPFFNKQERDNIIKAKNILRSKDLDVFVPMEHKFLDDDKMPNGVWGRLVYDYDKENLYQCDALVCVYYGLYSDSGTAWEVGFATALNKKIVVVHMDCNVVGSIMINNSANYNIDGLKSLKKFDFEIFNNNISNANVEQK